MRNGPKRSDTSRCGSPRGMAAISSRFSRPARCKTRRVRLGTAISSVFVRTAPTIAMAAAAVDELSGGRFVLGLGSSHRVQVGPEHGVEYREAARARAGYGGRGSRVAPRRARSPSRGDGPHRTFRPLVRAVSQGNPGLPVRTVPQDDGAVRRDRGRRDSHPGHARRARPRARAPSLPVPRGRVVMRPRSRSRRCCRRASPRTGRRRSPPLAPGLAFYAGFFPALQPAARRERISRRGGPRSRRRGPPGDTAGAERAVTDEMIAATGIAGTPAECRDRLEAYRASGLDLPIISPFARGPGARDRFLAAIEACAP